MEYRICHVTEFDYTEVVPVCHNQVHLTPRKTADQRCLDHHLIIHPSPSDRGRRIDYFGNLVNYFSIDQPHQALSITANSRVKIQNHHPLDVDNSPSWESVRDSLRQPNHGETLESQQFLYPSPLIPLQWPNDSAKNGVSCQLLEYASQSFTPNRPVLEAVRELTHRIHSDFEYDTTATTIQTSVGEVLSHRRGVCQDFANVEIACLRGLGLAARYVSGYLRTIPPRGATRLVGADQSHAWISVYLGPCGWVDFDPTNNMLTSTDHVTVAWGRDYGDVCPIQGVFVGGGQHTMRVSVDVTAV